jgi:hypothetical protein
MKIKSLIYPLITIVYWTFNAVYRIVDDSYMMKYDYANDPIAASHQEEEDMVGNPNLHNAVQSFLLIYILMSAIRGILYGFAFMAFEERIFFNIYRKCCGCCLKQKEFNPIDDNDELNRKSTEMAENSLVEEDEEEVGSSKKKMMNTEMETKEDE